MDWTVIGTGIGIVGLVYAFLRNFREDVREDINRIEKRLEAGERRVDLMEERMFLLATGKTLKEAMIETKMKLEGK